MEAIWIPKVVDFRSHENLDFGDPSHSLEGSRDLLTDVVLTSVGGVGVKGRGEGLVWVGEPLCPSVVASGGSKSSKI